MRILLTSGFMGDEAQLEQHEYPLIDKPYEAVTLAAAIRALLDRPKQTRRRRRSRASA
jgi:hypothetical protein